METLAEAFTVAWHFDPALDGVFGVYGEMCATYAGRGAGLVRCCSPAAMQALT